MYIKASINRLKENGLKWIGMDSDFQKYAFTNVEMNSLQSQCILFIY